MIFWYVDLIIRIILSVLDVGLLVTIGVSAQMIASLSAIGVKVLDILRETVHKLVEVGVDLEMPLIGHLQLTIVVFAGN